jgi:lipopolysaccharide transport system ATP-binding protein
MSDIAIRVEHLSKRYQIGALQQRHDTLRDGIADLFRSRAWPSADAIWALRDVSFEVQRGEVVGVIGRNGAGKTTLLKILSRITEPTAGRAEIHGRVGSLLEVGTGFHPELTGRENIYLNGAILGMRQAEIARRFDEIVAFAEIEKFLDTPVKRYSSGMYVRLAFAVAAHLEPEILLVDEVLAVGDIAFQKKCLGKMGDVARLGRTVLFVTHNLPMVLHLCPSSLLLRQGEMRAAGETRLLVNQYLHEDQAASGAVNFAGGLTSAPEDFAFIAARVLGPDETPSDQIMLSDGLSVEIEYEIRRALSGANISFHLWNSAGVCVLTSTDVDTEPARMSLDRRPGMYVATCHVPAQYLRADCYRLDLSASVPRVRWLAEAPSVLAFEVLDDGSVMAKLNQGRLGVVAPVLFWHTAERGCVD